MKTQKLKLNFKKSAITELQTDALLSVNGGSTIVGGGETCTGCCCVETLLTITGGDRPVLNF